MQPLWTRRTVSETLAARIPNEKSKSPSFSHVRNFICWKKRILCAIRVHELSDCHCAAAIKTGDKLFCTINAKWVPSHSDVEQWTYKCIVIFYRLLRYADNPMCHATYTSGCCLSVCVGGLGAGAGASDGRRVCVCIYYASHTIHKDNKNCWRHAVDEWSGASRWSASVTPPIYKMERFYTMNTYAGWHCDCARERQLPIDANDNNNHHRKRSEKRGFLLHIHSIGLMERERLKTTREKNASFISFSHWKSGMIRKNLRTIYELKMLSAINRDASIKIHLFFHWRYYVTTLWSDRIQCYVRRMDAAANQSALNECIKIRIRPLKMSIN